MVTDGKQTSGQEPALAGLTVTRVGEVMAHLRHFPPESSTEVLARLGLDEGSWGAGVDAWMDELAAQAAREEPRAAAQLGRSFAATRERLTAEQPSLDVIGTLPSEARAIDEIDDAPELEPEGGIAVPAYDMPTAGAAMLMRRASPQSSPWAADIAGTVMGSSVVERVLPFDPSAAPSLPPRDPKAIPVRPLAELGGTLGAANNEPGPVLPFSAPPAPLGYSLERYVSLCVELSVDSGRVEEVLRRYQLAPEQRAQLDAYWRKRMADEPSTWAAWDRGFRQYKAWFEATRGRT